MNELYAIMMSWAMALTGYPAPSSPAEVVMVSHGHLVENACSGSECKVLGWFPPGSKIFLDNRLNPHESLYASSVLVHEMVHYLQQESGRWGKPHGCAALVDMEREAYAIQRKYLTRYGVYQPVGASMHAVGCELAAQHE
jgi:hypothetical protein